MASFREQASAERFEKRRIPRFPVQLPAELGQDDNDTSSICTNLSSEGVSVETSQTLAVGERVTVRVVIAPREDPLRMLGKVMWKREIAAIDNDAKKVHEIGIRFIRPLPSPWKMQSEPDINLETLDEEVPEVIPYRRP